jgi:hypothetical protein
MKCSAAFWILPVSHRKLFHELDIPRDLVVGDLVLAELADLLGRGALAAVQLDPGTGQVSSPYLACGHWGWVVAEEARRRGMCPPVASLALDAERVAVDVGGAAVVEAGDGLGRHGGHANRQHGVAGFIRTPRGLSLHPRNQRCLESSAAPGH